MWATLERYGVPREYRSDACAAFIAYLSAQADNYAAALQLVLTDTEPIELWPAP